MNFPLVSIILPTYNGNHNWLIESIDSVLSQSFTDFELIIINDCSTNDIEKTILEYKQKDDRIVYIKNEKNLRLTKTLNKGIDLSKGKYIARIDDDDIWCDENKLNKQIEFMENNPDYGLCGTNIILIDEKGKEIRKITLKSSDKEIRNCILGGTQFAHSSVLFKKEAINIIGKYSEKWDFVEDHELWLRLGLKYKFCNLESYSFKYRVNEKGLCNSNSNIQYIRFLKLCLLYKNNYTNFIGGFYKCIRILLTFYVLKIFYNNK